MKAFFARNYLSQYDEGLLDLRLGEEVKLAIEQDEDLRKLYERLKERRREIRRRLGETEPLLVDTGLLETAILSQQTAGERLRMALVYPPWVKLPLVMGLLLVTIWLGPNVNFPVLSSYGERSGTPPDGRPMLVQGDPSRLTSNDHSALQSRGIDTPLAPVQSPAKPSTTLEPMSQRGGQPVVAGSTSNSATLLQDRQPVAVDRIATLSLLVAVETTHVADVSTQIMNRAVDDGATELSAVDPVSATLEWRTTFKVTQAQCRRWIDRTWGIGESKWKIRGERKWRGLPSETIIAIELHVMKTKDDGGSLDRLTPVIPPATSAPALHDSAPAEDSASLNDSRQPSLRHPSPPSMVNGSAKSGSEQPTAVPDYPGPQ